jgi:hypothetical protein
MRYEGHDSAMNNFDCLLRLLGVLSDGALFGVLSRPLREWMEPWREGSIQLAGACLCFPLTPCGFPVPG